jgi:hypothetical protein
MLETNEVLGRVARLLPKKERNLLALIRTGYSLPEAARKLGIPQGSRNYHHGRIVAYARREMHRRIGPLKVDWLPKPAGIPRGETRLPSRDPAQAQPRKPG